MAKKTNQKKASQQQPSNPLAQFILPGAQFDAQSFYLAKQAGVSDQDIIKNLQAGGIPISGQMQYAADNYERGLAQTSPSKLRGGLYSAGGQEWGPQLMITPNRFNPLLQAGGDPYNGRFANATGGDDPGQELARRGVSFSYGPQNAQQYLNNQYWKGQVNSNPSVSRRWHQGDTLDPGYSPGYEARLAAEYPGNTDELHALQNDPNRNRWREGLHETDPRFAQIASDPAAYAKYLTETNSNVGTSPAARWMEQALARDPSASTSMGAASGSTTGATAATGGLVGKSKMDAIKNAEKFGQALKIAASGDSLVGAKESMAIHRKFGKSADQQVDRLDKINLKQAAKKGPIGLTSNFTNKFMEGKLKNNPLAFSSAFMKPKGGLAQALGGMRDTTNIGMKGQASYTTPGFGKTPKGFGVMGFGAGKPIYQTAKSLGGWDYNPKSKPDTDTTTPPPPPPPPDQDPVYSGGGDYGGDGGGGGSSGGFQTGGIGDSGDKTALTFRQNKSRWKQNGKATKGTSNLRFTRSSGFGGFGGKTAVSAAGF
jgi:hypothetical protein